MIHLLIFSKNRACQLDLLLRSIKKRADIFDVHVLYKADILHRESYEILKSEHRVSFHEEENFYKDTLELSVSDKEYTCYMTDDDVMIRSVPKYEFWHHGDDHASFSLRLGDNVSLHHFAYKFSVDGHIMRRDYLNEWLLKVKKFNNPNQFESGMCGVVYGMPHMYHTPYLIGVPVNRVSSTSKCSYGDISEEFLLEQYLKGKRIKDPAKKLLDADNVHKIIEFEYKKQFNIK